MVTAPELLTVLLNVEALEDNEVLTIERARYISRISDPKQKANLETFDTAQKVRRKEHEAIHLNSNPHLNCVKTVDDEMSKLKVEVLGPVSSSLTFPLFKWWTFFSNRNIFFLGSAR